VKQNGHEARSYLYVMFLGGGVESLLRNGNEKHRGGVSLPERSRCRRCQGVRPYFDERFIAMGVVLFFDEGDAKPREKGCLDLDSSIRSR
jgi:hypothetical protein